MQGIDKSVDGDRQPVIVEFIHACGRPSGEPSLVMHIHGARSVPRTVSIHLERPAVLSLLDLLTHNTGRWDHRLADRAYQIVPKD